MTLSEAKLLVGNQPKWALRNMRRALEMLPWNNSANDWQRLEACYTVLRVPHKLRRRPRTTRRGREIRRQASA